MRNAVRCFPIAEMCIPDGTVPGTKCKREAAFCLLRLLIDIICVKVLVVYVILIKVLQ